MSRHSESVPSGPWTIGVARLGNSPREPKAEPQHWLHQRHEDPDGLVTVHLSPDHYLTAEEAISSMIRRLRDRGLRFTRDGLALKYRHPVRRTNITLTYSTECPDTQEAA